ncbi:MAG: YdcF family protein [Thermosynechococcaceae cyanobacterium]
MFLLLSKLLPLFIYPIGLTCVLLSIAIFCFWRKPRFAAVAVGLALFVLLVSSNTFVARGLVRPLEQQYLPTLSIPDAEAIVILGGCTRSKRAPRPWVEISEAGDRILYGAKLYQDGHAPWVILSGGRIDWASSGAAESVDMATLMQMIGVPSSAILQDSQSRNTRKNALNVQEV